MSNVEMAKILNDNHLVNGLFFLVNGILTLKNRSIKKETNEGFLFKFLNLIELVFDKTFYTFITILCFYF